MKLTVKQVPLDEELVVARLRQKNRHQHPSEQPVRLGRHVGTVASARPARPAIERRRRACALRPGPRQPRPLRAVPAPPAGWATHAP